MFANVKNRPVDIMEYLKVRDTEDNIALAVMLSESLPRGELAYTRIMYLFGFEPFLPDMLRDDIHRDGLVETAKNLQQMLLIDRFKD